MLFYGPEDYAACIEAVEELIARSAQGETSSLVPTGRELLYRSLEKTGDLARAASTLEAMAADTKEVAWLVRAGEDYYNAKNYKEAKRVYKAVVDRAGVPDEIRARCMHGLAFCYWDTGLKEAAKRLMSQVSERYPNTEGGMKARGSLYLWSQGE